MWVHETAKALMPGGTRATPPTDMELRLDLYNVTNCVHATNGFYPDELQQKYWEQLMPFASSLGHTSLRTVLQQMAVTSNGLISQPSFAIMAIHHGRTSLRPISFCQFVLAATV
jgi:hypothetical protein